MILKSYRYYSLNLPEIHFWYYGTSVSVVHIIRTLRKISNYGNIDYGCFVLYVNEFFYNLYIYIYIYIYIDNLSLFIYLIL